MKFVKFRKKKGSEAYGIIEHSTIKEIKGNIFTTFSFTNNIYALNNVKLLAPCTPTKVVCIGTNYQAHAVEMGKPVPQDPKLFIKPDTTVIGPEDTIIYPDWMSSLVHYEAELAVVIGKKAYRIGNNDPFDYVFGYTCLNDVTARDLQRKDGQFTRGKGFDTFCPIGPCIETDLDPTNAKVKSRLNGQLRQDGNSDDLIFPVAQLVKFISDVMTLYPGDIIATGTPSGVGEMKKGDVIEIEVGNIGVLKNSVV